MEVTKTALWSGIVAIALLGVLGQGGVCAQASAPVLTVDDAALRTRFQQELEALLTAGAAPTGSGLLSAWEKRPEEAPPPAIARSTERDLGKTLTSPEIYDRASRATVLVGHLYQCGKCDKWHPNIAGGVVIDPSGVVVTNHHVMEAPKAEVFGVMTAGGEVFPIVEVLAASKPDDLAVVRVKTDGRKLDAVAVAPGDDPVGSEVRVISHPDGRFFTYSEGIVARYYFESAAKAPRLQITADYAKGSSGCGVFNERGELMGIVSSTNSIYYTQENGDQKNLQMVVKSCIPIASLRKLLQSGQSE
jgi:serine protease Do